MMKFSLETKATFKAPVKVHVPGEGAAEIIFEFKARTRRELDEFQKELAASAQRFQELTAGEPSLDAQMKAEVQQIMGLAVNWNLPAEFNEANLFTLVDKAPGAMGLVFSTYLAELTGAARAGN